MVNPLLSVIAPHEQVWGTSEDVAVAVLFGVAVVLTLVVAGIFIFILTRKQQ